MFKSVKRAEEEGAAQKQKRLPKSLRHAMVSSVVLLVVFVSLGAAYTLYMDTSTTPAPVATTIPTSSTTAPVVKPVQPAANAKESAAVEMISSPVTPGSNATISVRTNPGSTCTIAAVYNNVPSTDSGLTTKSADEYGSINWSWTVGPSVPLGTWPVKITCAYHTQTAFVQADLVVAATAS